MPDVFVPRPAVIAGSGVRWPGVGVGRVTALLVCALATGTSSLAQVATYAEKLGSRLSEMPAKGVEPDPVRSSLLLKREARSIPVQKVSIRFGNKLEHFCPDEDLGQIRVVLSKRDNVLFDPFLGGEPFVARVAELNFPDPVQFDASAIEALYDQIASAMQRAGLAAVKAVPAPGQFDENGERIRKEDTDLTILVYVGEVAEVRSISTRGHGGEREINSSTTARLRDRSPIQPGDPVRIDELDDYALRLGRHPGRRVDVSLSPYSEFTTKDAQLSLDYLISEQKPWTIYAQVSNTGTQDTNQWRERFGFSHTSLTGHDDILRIDYLTAGFEASNSVNASYEFPLADRLKIRAYGGYNEYTASDVGFQDRNFSGDSWEAGGELIWNLWQRRDWFLDIFSGAKFLNVHATDQFGGEIFSEGETHFLLPYVGATLERNADHAATNISTILEFQTSGVGTEKEEAERLGRTPVDIDWTVLKFDASQSFYLEPFAGSVFRGMNLPPGQTWQPGMTLAHEIALSLRGQYAFDNRLIPNVQNVAGGMYSVRGYDESVAVGDTVVVGSIEYRFHVPRALRPSDTPVGSFRWRPEDVYGKADWDLILKGFADIGSTTNSDIQSAFEKDQTLIGAGIGAELQLNSVVRGALRLDLGFALKGLTDAAGNTIVEGGSHRLHFSFILLF